MTIIVDANILLSALISPNNKISKILSHPALPVKRISCNFLITELNKHRTKIVKYSKKSVDEVIEDTNYFLKNITLYNETFIHEQHWLEAERLTKGVDDFDINYVALTLQTDGWLWTGDKKLSYHLRAMGFDHVLNTFELYDILQISEL